MERRAKMRKREMGKGIWMRRWRIAMSALSRLKVMGVGSEDGDMDN
jgi:hypothetical protein